MFGLGHHCDPRFGGRWSGRHGWRGHSGRSRGGGLGGGDMVRAGRMLAQGDLRLIALALIAEQPRHGYEIIKVLEERTAGWYSPSPGIVYPTLTYLEETGYVAGKSEGAKKLYTITEDGRAHLEENREFVDAVLERLAAIGRKVSRMRRRFGDDEEDRRALTPLVRAAIENLREVATARVEGDSEIESKVVEALARAAAELKKI